MPHKRFTPEDARFIESDYSRRALQRSGISRNNSGMILIIVLWSMVILSMLAISLGRSTRIELSLTKYAIKKAKTKYWAWAGLLYAIDQIQLDSGDKLSNKTDTLYYCGIRSNQDLSAEDLFKDKPLGNGYFVIQYEQKMGDEGGSQINYGMRDEERLININGLTSQNFKILSSLIELLEFDKETARTIAASVVDWTDKNSVINDNLYGAENGYYNRLAMPYQCKNSFFDSKEELLLVRGMNKEVFEKLKGYITIFPKKIKLSVNFNTASEYVIRSFARAMSGAPTNTDISDADSLAEKLLVYRVGEDGEECTSDDRPIDFNKMALNAKEKVLFLSIKRYETNRSDYFYIPVKGVGRNSCVQTEIAAIVRRNGLSIVYWHRN